MQGFLIFFFFFDIFYVFPSPLFTQEQRRSTKKNFSLVQQHLPKPTGPKLSKQVQTAQLTPTTLSGFSLSFESENSRGAARSIINNLNPTLTQTIKTIQRCTFDQSTSHPITLFPRTQCVPLLPIINVVAKNSPTPLSSYYLE